MKQATELYEEMKKLFREELQSNVPPEIEEMMKQTLHQEKQGEKELGSLKSRPKGSLTGRERELQLVNGMVDEFLPGKNSDTLLIRGEAGCGKTILKDALVEELPPDVTVIQTNCFKPEQNILLSALDGDRGD